MLPVRLSTFTPIFMSILLPAARLGESGEPPAHHVVLALCAEWCGTCRSFRPVLEQLAAHHPQIAFAWLDIEDDAALAGDLDVETFPTLAIFRAGVPLYFGPTLPLEDVVAKLIRSAVGAPGPLAAIPDELGELTAQLFGPEA